MAETFKDIAARLRDEFADVKLLALGQTVYWDEPMKASLRRFLDIHLPERTMLVGVHDADYFSKTPADMEPGWAMVPHNDGNTRDLWVATGEISRLFGSETVPAKDILAAHGVQIETIARDYPGGKDALLDTVTEAWGWRGLVHVNSGQEVACCIPLAEALPHILQLISWGFNATLDSISDPAAKKLGRMQADELVSWVTEYANAHPDAYISDLYCNVLKRFYGRLLGHPPANLELTKATSLFRFNTQTAKNGVFRLLGLFLSPETHACACNIYNQSVEGSDIYTLDRFPPGAIPFDLVIPHKGRGTICLREDEVMVDLDEPVSIKVDGRPSTPEELAELLEGRFGPDIALVGKALTLVLMISSQYIFVLHEQASGYVPSSEKMAALLNEQGIGMQFYPILRIGYSTWDSLPACSASFSLPPHMADTFRQGEITSQEFADIWHPVLEEQRKLLSHLSSIQDTEALLLFLSEEKGAPWPGRTEEYRRADAEIRRLSRQTEPVKAESVRLRELSYARRQEVQAMEAGKGRHFRTYIKPRRDELDNLEVSGTAFGPRADALRAELALFEEERAGIEQKIEQKRQEAEEMRTRSLELKHQVQQTEKSEEAQRARQTLQTVKYEAELARLWMVRDAFLTAEGLSYTNNRPSAWWFLLADPELKWFNRVAETAEFRFEEVAPSRT